MTWIIFCGSKTERPVPVDERTGLPLPPIKDTRSGSFIACGDCASRSLHRLCSSTCPRARAWNDSLHPRLAVPSNAPSPSRTWRSRLPFWKD